jgi:gluconate 5-dehydrogenase
MSQATSAEPTVQQLFDLSGKTALVTGVSGWLGSALARGLAEAGAAVVASSRDAARAAASADALPRTGGVRHHAVQLDHMNEESLKAGFEQALHKAGRIDVLVNNGH